MVYGLHHRWGMPLGIKSWKDETLKICGAKILVGTQVYNEPGDVKISWEVGIRVFITASHRIFHLNTCSNRP